MDPARIRIDRLERAEQASALEVDAWAFPQDDPDHDIDVMFDSLHWDRFFGAWVETASGERLAGINSTYRFEMTVPGDGVTPLSVPCAGLTWVGVHPQFRRRGVLTAMMRHQLRAVREEGSEPIGALFASEPEIYGRFGYGLAARHLRLTLPSGAALRPVPGSEAVDVRFELADHDRHAELVGQVYERARLRHPGSVSRPTLAMNRYVLLDAPSSRVGSERMRIAIASDPRTGEPTGHAIFRRRLSWGDLSASGTQVHELVAADAASEHALWTRVLSLDLMQSVRAHHIPTDGLLATSLERLPSETQVSDNLWVRIVHLQRALESRRYAFPFGAVLEVSDGLFAENAGRWRLDGGPDGATCVPSSDEPDLVLDVRELGSAYIGGTTLSTLVAAGLATACRPERLREIASAFQSPVQPVALWGF